MTRTATLADNAAIARIHNGGIAERITTVRTAPRTAEQVVAWAAVGEHSAYLDPRHRGVGASRAALDALRRACVGRGFWKLISCLFLQTSMGLALHERAGFRVVGVYRRHGRLDGEWRDRVIVENLLGCAAEDR